MSEAVRACEEAFVELYQIISKTQLVSESELQFIIKRRRTFEEEIRKSGSDSKNEILRYIAYDKQLVDSFQIKANDLIESTKEITKAMNHRIKMIRLMLLNNVQKLYVELLNNFPNDMHHWALYLDFCREHKMYNLEDKMISKFLTRHSGDPLSFAYIAEWKFLKSKSHEQAREVLLKGIQLHKDNKDLYLELIKNELDFVMMLREEHNKELDQDSDDVISDDPILNGSMCEMVFDFAKKNIPVNTNLLFYKDLILLCKEYAWTQELQKKLISSILKENPKNELWQDLFARTNLKTKIEHVTSTPYPMDEINNTYKYYTTLLGLSSNSSADKTCLESQNNNDKEPMFTSVKITTQKMWNYAVDFILEILDQCERPGRKLVLPKYFDLLNKGHKCDKLSVDHYLNWIKHLKENSAEEISDKEIDKLFKHMTTNLTLANDPRVWLEYIKHKKQSNTDSKDMYEMCIKGLNGVLQHDRSLPIDELSIQLCKEIYHNKTHAISLHGLESVMNRDLCIQLRLNNLEYLNNTVKNIEQVRKFYLKVSKLAPFSLELNNKMYEIESSRSDPNKELLDHICLMNTVQLGNQNTGVWIQSMKHDLRFNEGANIEQIYQRAIFVLNHSKSLKDDLEMKYSDIKNSYINSMKITKSDELKSIDIDDW